MSLADFVKIDGFKVIETFKHLDQGYVIISLEKTDPAAAVCHRCGNQLDSIVGQHRIKAKYLPIFSFEAFLACWRRKGFCSHCKKIRSEKLDFLSEESPHLSKGYESTLEELSEIAPISRVAEYSGEDKSTLWRIDLKRMQRLFKTYRIPDVTHISVDEVYAKNRHEDDETRNDRFFTIVTDVKRRKVIWVSFSRRKEGLDAFYQALGPERCAKIKVVAQDQHEDYRQSTLEHCKNAEIVYDRFHVIKSFMEALDKARKDIIKLFNLSGSERKKLGRNFKYVLTKKGRRRSEDELMRLQEAVKTNKLFINLDMIKEAVIQLFSHEGLEAAELAFEQLGDWIKDAGFPSLKRWYRNLSRKWDHLAAYFKTPITSALSEGVNNVIKAIKRRAYGYRNMEYFRLKIMQVCGFLTTKGMQQLANERSTT